VLTLTARLTRAVIVADGRAGGTASGRGLVICACEIDAEMGSNLDFLFSVHFFRC
jgi:hypothetical protein